jgi:hypothetical protein
MNSTLIYLSWWLLGLNGATINLTRPDADESVLVLYRQREFGGRDFTLYVNSNRIGTLSTNRFLRVNVQAGRVKIESKRDFFTENKTLTFTAEPGRTYYIKAVEEVDFMSRSLLMAQMGEEQAKRELARVKPMEPQTPDNP